MKKNTKYRLLVILLVIVGSVYLFYPLGEKINLGLDLRGGMHLVLQVNVEEALAAEVQQARERVERELRQENVTFTETRVADDHRIEILGVPLADESAAAGVFRLFADSWTYTPRYAQEQVDFVLTLTAAARRALGDLTVRQAREVIEHRVDQYGVAEPSITVYGSGDIRDQIIVELPGVDDPGRVRNLLTTAARLDLKLVYAEPRGGPYVSREAAQQAFDNGIPPDYEILPYRNPTETGGQTMYLVVRKAPSLTGRNLKNARRSQDAFTGRAEVAFFLDSEGVRLFTRTTEENVGNRLAIVLDHEVRSAPTIQERIPSDSARITGGFTPEQAEDLALTLRSGALPASVAILQNRVVGPSLGMDSIRRGVTACIVGFSLVMVAMLVLFRLAGVNAVFCLILNLMVLMGVLAYFKATLTLPGIAGIILTIGMAVDANILIFERIKEELRQGKTIRSSIDAGFSKVFSTIIDTNITTLVAALFLFQFGTGPVRGFAITLAVGLLANIFAATFVSRTMLELLFRGREVQKISI